MTVQEAAQQPGFVAGMTITILATLLLTFCADLLVVGHIRHARDQQTSFADLRGYLAAGTAAVNQTQDDGALVPLGTPIGVLEIPQIGLREVFFEGTTAGVLMSGPGHRRDSPLPGQAGSSVIMGRKAAYGGPFSYLEQLSVGQVFTVVTGQGRQYFRVSGIRHSGKGSPPVVGLGESRLMLVTASGGDYQPNGAVYVDATFVGWTAVDGTADKAPLTNAVLESGPRPLSAVDLPIAERPLRGDDGALPAILLWSVLLAAGALVTAWLRLRWGKWQVWLAGAPPLLAAGLTLSDQLARLLPNLM
jgi:LPXTG-site transpeptidase (sortase) family protein